MGNILITIGIGLLAIISFVGLNILITDIFHIFAPFILFPLFGVLLIVIGLIIK